METITNHVIKEATWPEKWFITKRARLAFDRLTAFFGESYAEIYGALGKAGIQVTDPPCAIYYSIDEKNGETELAAAVPVHGPVPEIEGMEKLVLPPCKVVTTTHTGPYDRMVPAYRAMEQYLVEHGMKQSLIIEEYFSDPAVEQDPANWKTDIHFIIS